MDRRGRSGIAFGVVLILLGIAFFVVQFFPGLGRLVSWPLIVIGVGVLLLLIGLLTGERGMAVPACIVGGIGGLLFYQNATGDWASWSYAWSLIPGFTGVGTLLSGLIGGNRGEIRGGLWLVLISAILFLVFGSFFGAFGFLGKYWPVLIVLFGVILLIQALVRPKE